MLDGYVYSKRQTYKKIKNPGLPLYMSNCIKNMNSQCKRNKCFTTLINISAGPTEQTTIPKEKVIANETTTLNDTIFISNGK